MAQIIPMSDVSKRKRTPGRVTASFKLLLAFPFRLLLALLLPVLSLTAWTCGLLASAVASLTGAFPVDFTVKISKS